MRTTRLGSLLALLLLLAPAAPARAQVHHLARMNMEQLKALDRTRTVIVLPGGILEQHGPYLPSFTDGYANEAQAKALSQAIAARPGWQAVIFPTIPLGVGGANEIGRKHVFPGTYAVRTTTLRAVFMDLAAELGEQGFRWIFVIHGHGAPNHNRVLHQAGDYFRDVYGGHMVHLSDVIPEGTSMPGGLTEAEQQEDGFTVHAGLWETSSMMFLHPELVSPAVREAVPQTGQNWNDLVRLARAPEWPGYFGSPRLATAARGAQLWQHAESYIEVALRILDGLDERQIPRLSDVMSKSEPNLAIDRDAVERERQVEQRQHAWLKKHVTR